MGILNYVRSFVDDAKAVRRGERRLPGTRQLRGRVYAKKDGGSSVLDGPIRTIKQPTAELTMRVIRADGTSETIKVPAQVTQHG